MIDISILRKYRLLVNSERLRLAAEATFKYMGVSPITELGIAIVSDASMKRLNKIYRGINITTDVLSFLADENNPETQATYLGDVIISYSEAELSAKKEKSTVLREIQLLIIHGILHLLGYDHVSYDDSAIMKKHQKNILAGLPKLPSKDL